MFAVPTNCAQLLQAYSATVRQELQSNSTHLAVPGTEGFSVREAPKGEALTR